MEKNLRNIRELCIIMVLMGLLRLPHGMGDSTTATNTNLLSTPLFLDPASNSTCDLTLANNMTYGTLKQQFQMLAAGGTVCVFYFHLRIQTESGDIVPFTVSGSDTFAPDQWVWATTKGKNLLRMPLDSTILSLGLLSINTLSMDIILDPSSSQCLASQPYSYTTHVIAKYITENITANGTTVGLNTDGPIVCRSAFAFTHRMFGEMGIGFKCCRNPVLATDQYVCDTEYTASWELVWYGPIVLMCWVYAIGFIHFYKLYRHALVKQKIRQISGLEETIDDIKQDIVSRIVKLSVHIARIETPDALIALRERCSFLDVLGVSKISHYRITVCLRILFVSFLLAAYYFVCIIFLYEYKLQLSSMLARLNDSRVVYLNVIGHFGWVFCPHDVGIFSYAVFEMIYMVCMPVFATIVYVSIIYRHEAKVLKNDSDATKTQTNGYKRLFLRFISSRCGKTLQILCFFMFFIYVILIAGVFLTYVVYFVGLGVFANIDVVSPWIIPLGICFHFFATSFNSAYSEYQVIKNTSFSLCLDDYKELIIRQQKEVFLPRDLIETFYIPNSRPTIYSCFLRIFWVFAFLLLLILVVLTLQYPYYHQSSSIISFLGVQVVFILPLLAQFMYNNAPLSSLEENILKRDMKEFIKKYIKDHPDVVKELQKEHKKRKEEDNMSTDDELENGRHDNGDDGGGDGSQISVGFQDGGVNAVLIQSSDKECLEMKETKNARQSTTVT